MQGETVGKCAKSESCGTCGSDCYLLADAFSILLFRGVVMVYIVHTPTHLRRVDGRFACACPVNPYRVDGTEQATH